MLYKLISAAAIRNGVVPWQWHQTWYPRFAALRCRLRYEGLTQCMGMPPLPTAFAPPVPPAPSGSASALVSPAPSPGRAAAAASATTALFASLDGSAPTTTAPPRAAATVTATTRRDAPSAPLRLDGLGPTGTPGSAPSVAPTLLPPMAPRPQLWKSVVAQSRASVAALASIAPPSGCVPSAPFVAPIVDASTRCTVPAATGSLSSILPSAPLLSGGVLGGGVATPSETFSPLLVPPPSLPLSPFLVPPPSLPLFETSSPPSSCTSPPPE
jgi:hypothetical protein